MREWEHRYSTAWTKAPMSHFQLFVWTKDKGKVWDHVAVQRSSRAVMKASIRFLEQKSRPFKGPSSSGSCGHKGGAAPGAPWPAQRLLAQVQGEAQDRGGGRLSAPLLVSSCPVCGSGPGWGMYWLIKIQGGEDSNEELHFRMLLIHKLVNNEKEKKI